MAFGARHMKIALVRRMYSLRKGGAERQCVNLARQLMAMGHDVTAVGERIDPDLESEIRFLTVPVNQATSWTKNRSFAKNVGTVLKGDRFDITYGLSRTPAVDIYRLTERLHTHWMKIRYPGWFGQGQKRLNPRHRAILQLDRSIFESPTVRRLVTQSQLDRRLLGQYFNVPAEKIAVIHNGVDTAAFQVGESRDGQAIRAAHDIPNGVPLLLFASTMDFEGKGLRWILHAMKHLEHDTAQLIVLGEGPQRKFATLARSLGLADRVDFAGARSDIQQYYRAADLFLMPTSYEPFPNVNLEAMACGTPVLTTATAGGADVIDEGENGYVIDRADDWEKMRRCIDRHLSLPDDRRGAMSKKSRAKAEAYSVQANANCVVELFEQVMREKLRD